MSIEELISQYAKDVAAKALEVIEEMESKGKFISESGYKRLPIVATVLAVTRVNPELSKPAYFPLLASEIKAQPMFADCDVHYSYGNATSLYTAIVTNDMMMYRNMAYFAEQIKNWAIEYASNLKPPRDMEAISKEIQMIRKANPSRFKLLGRAVEIYVCNSAITRLGIARKLKLKEDDVQLAIDAYFGRQ